MANLRATLAGISGNLEESMGARSLFGDFTRAPVPHARDVARRPARQFGRIAIDHVVPDPEQPRAKFAEDALGRLAASIKAKGQLMPIRVRWSADLNKWVIVFGERRWRAARRAGLTEIDCFFHEAELTAEEILEQQLVENCVREDLTPLEEANAFAKLIECKEWTGKQLAEALRISESRISRTLALLRLPENIKKQVDAGSLSGRTAYELSRLEGGRVQAELADRVIREKLTAQQTAGAVRKRSGKATFKPCRTKQSFLSEGGWKVLVTGPGRGTYHDIENALANALEDIRHRIDNGRQL